jgi:hypothetical protein
MTVVQSSLKRSSPAIYTPSSPDPEKGVIVSYVHVKYAIPQKLELTSEDGTK